jgi:hypothetical protein
VVRAAAVRVQVARAAVLPEAASVVALVAASAAATADLRPSAFVPNSTARAPGAGRFPFNPRT